MNDLKISQFENGGTGGDSSCLRSIRMGFDVPHVCLAYLLATFRPETAALRKPCLPRSAFRFLPLGQLQRMIADAIAKRTGLSRGLVSACLSDLRKNLNRTGREVLPRREAERLAPAWLDQPLAATPLVAFLPGHLESVHIRTLAKWAKQFRRRLERHRRKAHLQAEFAAQAEPCRPALHKYVWSRLSDRWFVVDDIVQDTFLVAWLQYDGKEKITYWALKNIARELISRYWREQSPLGKLILYLEELLLSCDEEDRRSWSAMLADPASLPEDSPYEALNLDVCLLVLGRVAASKNAPWKVLACLGFMLLGLRPGKIRDRFYSSTLREIAWHLQETYASSSAIPSARYDGLFHIIHDQLDKPLLLKRTAPTTPTPAATNPGAQRTLGDRKFADCLPWGGKAAQAKAIGDWIRQIRRDVEKGLFRDGGEGLSL